MTQILDRDRLYLFFNDPRYFKNINSASHFYQYYKILDTQYFVGIMKKQYSEEFTFVIRSGHELLTCSFEEVFNSCNKDLQRKFLYNMDQFCNYQNAFDVLYMPGSDRDKFI